MDRPGETAPRNEFAFISYDHQDQAYARALADDLRAHGIEPWIDDRIDFGDRWWRTIVQRLGACSAVVVIMTPEAEVSEWVEREVQLALREHKPIVPLCLRGDAFALLVNIQYVNVRDGRMPPPRFYRLLARALGRRCIPSVPDAPAQVEPAATRAEWEPFEPEMILVPAGEFLMGTDRGKDRAGLKEEEPQHTLSLAAYHIGRVPVTNAQYLAFVWDTRRDVPDSWSGSEPPKGMDDHPVCRVSWRDALAYCSWLAEASGRAYTLPSEAEWEKAARGGDDRIYPWGDEWDAGRCNGREGGIGRTAAVTTYPRGASPHGLLDMAGNVWEWTRSLFKPYPYDPADGRENLGVSGVRVVRGGSYDVLVRELGRCSSRFWRSPDRRYWDVGFRVVIPAAC
jgi:formylglycine-generating enzyme required for sulfatase activity